MTVPPTRFPKEGRAPELTPAVRAAPSAAPVSLSASTLQDALTPRGLFTNLFPLTFESANLGTLQQTEKAKKEDFGDRRRPRFYQADDTCFAYGVGLDDFKDSRFTPAIVAPGSQPRFALHLAKYGLMEFLRARGYLVRPRLVGISVLDHENPITSSEGFVKILPDYTLQTNLIEDARGREIFAMSIDAGWSTVPVFELGPRVAQRPDLLGNLKLVLDCGECGVSCPLHERLGRVVGVFDSFAEEGTVLTSGCRHADYIPQPVRVRQRVKSAATRHLGKKAPVSEQIVVVPGQVVKPAAGQRQVLRLSRDRTSLTLGGRIWLGDLTATHRVRADGLKTRYEHIQRFLARLAGHETAGVTFNTETGVKVTLERMPITTELIAND